MDFGGVRAAEAKPTAAATAPVVAQPSGQADPKWEEMRRAREAYEEKLARHGAGADAGSSGAASAAVGGAAETDGAGGLSRREYGEASAQQAPQTGGWSGILGGPHCYYWSSGGRQGSQAEDVGIAA